MNTHRRLTSWLLTIVIALAAVGCTTTEYRQIQSDFEQAVRSDNAQLALIDRSGLLYEAVATELSDQRIAELDEKLRPNAWLLRSFSEWRSGKLTEARASAQKGLDANPQAGSRDDVLLHLMPALVIDSEIMTAWAGAGKVTDPANYNASQKRDFETALEKLDDATETFGLNTPQSTKHYVEYQRWRIIQNWREVISRIEDGPTRIDAKDAALVNGKTLKAAAEAAKNSIPPDDPLRLQIIEQGG